MYKWVAILFFICLVPFYLNAQISCSFTFSPDNACSGSPVQFTSAVTSPNTSPKIYSWNFGDGVTSTIANPIHTYTAYGCNSQSYNAVLTVTDTTKGNTVSNSYTSIVNVKCKPRPQLSDLLNHDPFSNCSNSPTSEKATFDIKVQNTTANTGCILSFTLNWGDGDSLTGLQMTDFPLDHKYLKLGAFNLVITAIAANGCNGSTTYIVRNQSNPAVGLASNGGTEGCAPQTFPFTVTKDEKNSPGTTYQWDFGDNSPIIVWTRDSIIANNGNILHVFNSTSCGKPDNVFSVKLTAVNSCKSTPVTIGGITMWSAPVPEFSTNTAEGCENDGVFCFANLTTPGGWGSDCDRTTTYLWDMGNGHTSTLQTPPCQTYPVAGLHTISLTASNKCGSKTITHNIAVQSPATAIAEADKYSGCVPFFVSYTNKSTDSTTLSYFWSVSPNLGWSFINGSNSHSKNPEMQFTIKGTYIITLTVTNKCGDKSTAITIQANDIPTVGIPIIPDNCFPFTYTGNASYINNGSAITAYAWSVDPPNGWNFVAPSTSGSLNPVILFSEAGTYQVTVKATNECGSGDSISNKFEVFTPVPVTVGNDTVVCLNSADFKLAATPKGGIWSGINVSIDGIFTPATPGDYTLTYSRGTGNCQRQDQVTVKVAQSPNVDVGPDFTVCINKGIQTLTANPAGGTWSGTGITNAALGTFNPIIAGTGTFPLLYSYSDALSKCSNSDDLLITVSPFPTVDAEDITVCNQPIPEQLSATPAGGLWSGPNVTSTGLFTPNGLGNFLVTYTYTDNNSCSNSDVMTVTVTPPDATVSAGNDKSICSNENVALVGFPSGGKWSGANVTTDGFFAPVSTGNFKFVYSLGSGSCFMADTMLMTVKPSPKAQFLSNNVCFGNEMLFQDQSQGGGVNLTSWHWRFGDDNTAQAQNPPHYYSSADSYLTSLVVENASGCTDSIEKQIEVLELPVVKFNFDIPACTNVPVNFVNTSSNAQTFLWEFGDGSTASEVEPKYNYTLEGSYNVKLTATSGLGCALSDSLVLNITGPPPQPVFKLTTKEGCSPLTTKISFDNSQYNANSTYYWDFGNGLTSKSLSIPDSLIYTGSLTGDTVLYVRFTSRNYCDSIIYTDSIRVHNKPLSRFDMLHNWDCTPVEVQFRNVSTGSPDVLFWDFGDGTTSNQLEPVHSYTTGANSTLYNISLVAHNGCGSDTLTKDLLVKPKTVHAKFTVGNFKGCEGDPFCFQNYSTDASMHGISNLSWDFGDGHGSSTENPCHIFTHEGTYTVTLHVDNGCGYDETFDAITINPVPQLQISSNNEACEGETMLFDYKTNVDIGGLLWHFGDGDSSVLSNPTHTYKNSGIYKVILSGESAFEFPVCIGVTSKLVEIKPSPESFISPDTSGCAPFQITFQGDAGSSHLWNFGDNLTFTSDPTHVFEAPGLFKVKLISENANKCKDSDSIEIRVLPSPKSQFTYTSSGGYPEYLTFINSSIDATACNWDFGNGQGISSCDVNDVIKYSNNGTYTVTLETWNQYGCSDTATVSFPIYYKGLFVPNALIPEHPDPDENLFLPKGIGIMEYTIQIYDTWGNLIWQSSALQDGMPSEGWNGRDKNGNLYPQDVYAWRASAKFTDGTSWSGNNGKTYGTVTLIR